MNSGALFNDNVEQEKLFNCIAGVVASIERPMLFLLVTARMDL